MTEQMSACLLAKVFACREDLYRILLTYRLLSVPQYSVRVEKGEYTLLMRIRHEKRELLEKLSDLSLQITFKLSSELRVSVGVLTVPICAEF